MNASTKTRAAAAASAAKTKTIETVETVKSSRFVAKAKELATSDAAKNAAKSTVTVVGGAALLGVGYAVFVKTANAAYAAMS